MDTKGLEIAISNIRHMQERIREIDWNPKRHEGLLVSTVEAIVDLLEESLKEIHKEIDKLNAKIE